MTRLILRWDDPSLLSRVRNMGEDVWGELRETDEDALSLAAVDAATDHFEISVGRSEIGSVTELIRRKLKRHNLENDVRIERG